MYTKDSLIAGRYQFLSQLGVGSMGTVVRVADRGLDNEICALKLLHPRQADDEVTLARFRNEVILARRLGHSHIARIYDLGVSEHGYHYISMEYVSGGSLAERMSAKTNELIAYADKLRWLSQIASGIAFAHDMGVVHRDLKPDNILLDEHGRVKITDFGLARSLQDDKGFTATGETVGTPCYMAPEQFRGEKVDGRCDIYALGIIAFELINGVKPFYHDNYVTLAGLHMQAPLPRMATGWRGTAKKLEAVIERCAAKHAKGRFQTAHQVVKALEEFS